MAVRVGMLSVLARFLFLAARVVERCLEMVMRSGLVMGGCFVVKSGRPCLATLATDFLIEFVAVLCSRCLAAEVTGSRIFFRTSGCHGYLL